MSRDVRELSGLVNCYDEVNPTDLFGYDAQRKKKLGYISLHLGDP